ncbi:MAG TPA: precorrin-6y C5,15-methyltransferase (decarboxylating) subunit CbiE [Desulfotomaculum sp.]|nr:precorrin-6y C5,15-methyltransferase (decarboxylating) subunit CbiE [Desulfotomaculum sp.]
MDKIKVIGVGPGGEDYLLPAAQKAIEEADILVGGRRAMALFNRLKKEKRIIDASLSKVTDFLNQKQGKKVAVLVSGDPGLYSFLDYLLKHFGEEKIEVVPGLSPVQVAFARARMSWQDAVIISLHGREKEKMLAGVVVPAVKESPKVALLTDQDMPPQKIAAYLLARGMAQKIMFIGDNLSYPQERFVRARLDQVPHLQEQFNNCVVLITNG